MKILNILKLNNLILYVQKKLDDHLIIFHLNVHCNTKYIYMHHVKNRKFFTFFQIEVKHVGQTNGKDLFFLITRNIYMNVPQQIQSLKIKCLIYFIFNYLFELYNNTALNKNTVTPLFCSISGIYAQGQKIIVLGKVKFNHQI